MRAQIEKVLNSFCRMDCVSENDLSFLKQTICLYGVRQEHVSRPGLIIYDVSLIRSVSNGSVMDLSAFQTHISFPETSLTLAQQNLHYYCLVMWEGENHRWLETNVSLFISEKPVYY